MLKTKPLTLLMAQINPTVGAITANTNQIIDIIEQHQTTHDLIIFPELVLTGYPPEDLLLRGECQERVDTALHLIAARTKETYAVVGHPLQENQARFNALSIFH